jgi:hypothetical protein
VREVARFFADVPLGRTVYERVRELLDEPYDVRVSKTQVAFRRRRGFAYIWLPDMHLKKPQADVVLSITLEREVRSPRFKEVVHPSNRIWMHHLEIQDVAELDDEVAGWLREAEALAG